MPEKNGEKVDVVISPVARAVAVPPHDFKQMEQEIRAALGKTTPELMVTSEELKIETIVLTSVIIDTIVDRLCENRMQLPPYGLGLFSDRGNKLAIIGDRPATFAELGPLPKITDRHDNPFEVVKSAIGETLYVYTDDVLNTPNEIGRVVDRYKQTFSFVSHQYERGARTPHIFIKKGCTTAANFIVNLFEAIFDLRIADKNLPKPTTDELLNIARNSLPTIMKLAMLDINTLVNLENTASVGDARLASGKFNPAYFCLVSGREDQKKLDLAEGVLEGIHTRSQAASPSTGCPAHVKFNQKGSSIARLWELGLSILPDIYEVALQEREKAIY